jgi:hypothetical protein
VTVTVDAVVPSDGTLVGLADTVETFASAAPGVNVTLAVAVTATLSVVSVAAMVTVSAEVSFRPKITFPEESVTPGVAAPATGGALAFPLASVNVSVTVLPWRAFPNWSSIVTTMDEELDPSAGTVVGLALTVDLLGDGTGVSNITDAVCVSGVLSVTSVAVKTTVSAVESEMVKTAVPFAPLTTDVGETVAVVAGAADSDTVFPLTGLPPELSSVTVTGVPWVPAVPTCTTGDAATTVELPAET